MDLDNAIAGRRSVRDYTSQGVDEKVITNLIRFCRVRPERSKRTAMDVHGRPRPKRTRSALAGCKIPYARDDAGGRPFGPLRLAA